MLDKGIRLIGVLALFASFLSCGGGSSNAFNEGRKAEARKDWDTALVDYEKALQRDPANSQYILHEKQARLHASMMHLENGRRLLKDGKIDEAAGELKKATSIDSTNQAAAQELESLSHQQPAEVNWERLSQDFGVPHPILAQTYARELLNVEPFPAFEGYSSRLLAESFDSSNLYWARLADEMGYSPVLLNRLAPELTRRMVEKIFATNFEDWPAILRAMRETGEELRQGKIALLTPSGAVAQ